MLRCGTCGVVNQIKVDRELVLAVCGEGRMRGDDVSVRRTGCVRFALRSVCVGVGMVPQVDRSAES
jgi:hypothetical protein